MSILSWDSLPPHPVEHVHSPQLAITPNITAPKAPKRLRSSIVIGPPTEGNWSKWYDWMTFLFSDHKTSPKLHKNCSWKSMKFYHTTTLPPKKGETRFSITGSIKHWGAGTAKDSNGEGGACRWKPTYLGSPVLGAPSRCYIRIIHWAVYTTYIRCK